MASERFMQHYYGANGFVPHGAPPPLNDRIVWFLTAMRNRAKDTGDADVVQEAEFLLTQLAAQTDGGKE